ncbi:hypothetical protein [Noviherbaspirillum malthae]|uniref:hypothetical protein n=1 Tax=Noviherbaspirillum malthae TaxID=1260987 RepID=UPI00188EAC1F|nr:hypothetical protein [Noviherbaspirillum malthae]
MPKVPNELKFAKPTPDISEVIATDEFAGKGGSYIFDPATGTRSPAPQPEETPTEKE